MDSLSPQDYIPQELPLLFEDEYVIYALRDPRTQIVRYIGMTKQPQIRLQQHIQRSYGTNYDWLQEVLQEHLDPIMEIIETVRGKPQAKQRELYWIHFHDAQSPLLVNKHPHKKRSVKDRSNYRT